MSSEGLNNGSEPQRHYNADRPAATDNDFRTTLAEEAAEGVIDAYRKIQQEITTKTAYLEQGNALAAEGKLDPERARKLGREITQEIETLKQEKQRLEVELKKAGLNPNKYLVQ